MLGVQAVDLATLQAGLAQRAQAALQPATPQPAAESPVHGQPAGMPRPKAKLANATMLGMPVASMAALGSPPSAAAPQPAGSPQTFSQAASPQPAAAPPQSAPKRNLGPQTNRTMLGIAVAQLPSAEPGVAAPGHVPGAMPVHGQRPRAAVAYADDEDLQLPGHRAPSRGLLFAFLALLALVVFVASGVGLYVALRGGGPDVRVAVLRTEAGDVLQVEVPEAVLGTKLRFNGLELPLVAGRATFPLAPDALHVGTNTVAVAVVSPGGDAATREIALDVDFRVHADLAALVGPTPTVAIVIDARPGSVVLLDAVPLPLSASGHAVRRYPVDATSARDGRVTHLAHYAITPPGGLVAQGTLTTQIPVTTMQIDRPGLVLVTDRDRVELAGAVDAAATVTVDGVTVPVAAGRFVHRLPLAALGQHSPRIVASAPGKAPHAVTLDIRRVADLAVEARSFAFDASLTYARLKPAVRTYQGQHVGLEGRVYNVEISGGRSVVQLLVRDCPRGEQCPLWVTYPAATDVTVNGWVRVLGTVAGEQQFRSESGHVNTVPKVDAAFLLPLPS